MIHFSKALFDLITDIQFPKCLVDPNKNGDLSKIRNLWFWSAIALLIFEIQNCGFHIPISIFKDECNGVILFKKKFYFSNVKILIFLNFYLFFKNAPLHSFSKTKIGMWKLQCSIWKITRPMGLLSQEFPNFDKSPFWFGST